MLKSKDSIYLQYQKGDEDICGPENYEYRKGCSKTINIQKKTSLYTCCKYKTLDAINVYQYETDSLHILAFNNLVVFGVDNGGDSDHRKLVIIYKKYNKYIDSLVNGGQYLPEEDKRKRREALESGKTKLISATKKIKAISAFKDKVIIKIIIMSPDGTKQNIKINKYDTIENLIQMMEKIEGLRLNISFYVQNVEEPLSNNTVINTLPKNKNGYVEIFMLKNVYEDESEDEYESEDEDESEDEYESKNIDIRAYIPITIENEQHLLDYLKNSEYSDIYPHYNENIIYPNTYDVIMIGEYSAPVKWSYQTMDTDVHCPIFFTIGKTRIIENTENIDEGCPKNVIPTGKAWGTPIYNSLLVPDYFGLYFNYLNNPIYFSKKSVIDSVDYFTIEVSGKDPIIVKLFGNLLPNIKDTHILLDIGNCNRKYSSSFHVIRVHIEKKRKCLKGENVMYDTIWESSGEDSDYEPVLVVSGPHKYKMKVPQFKYSPNY